MEKMIQIDRREVYNGKRVHLVIDKLKTPDDKYVDWELIVHPGAAAVIPIDNDGKIIMVRQYRNAVDDYVLEIPAGILEDGEDPKLCAYRELQEETGYRSDNMQYFYKFYSCIGICDEVIHIFVANGLSKGKQNLDEDEYVTVEKYDLDTLINMIFKGEIVDNKTISALLAFKNQHSRFINA